MNLTLVNLTLDRAAYYDISPLLSEKTAVFPGDVPLVRKVALDFTNGDNLVLSSLEFSAHLGAHADAPSHYHAKGESIETRGLHYYLGLCQVVRVQLARDERILPAHLSNSRIQAPRVLFYTGSYPNPDQWNADFNSLSPELITALASQGVVLVGIDTPSIDPSTDKLLPSHQAVFQHNMAVLEGLVLSEVPEGLYTLIALPLRIKGSDSSPVRAVLVK